MGWHQVAVRRPSSSVYRPRRDARILATFFTLPQVGETIIPQLMDVAGELLLYDELTTTVYLANA
jgi:hypothetical protein